MPSNSRNISTQKLIFKSNNKAEKLYLNIDISNMVFFSLLAGPKGFEDQCCCLWGISFENAEAADIRGLV